MKSKRTKRFVIGYEGLTQDVVYGKWAAPCWQHALALTEKTSVREVSKWLWHYKPMIYELVPRPDLVKASATCKRKK